MDLPHEINEKCLLAMLLRKWVQGLILWSTRIKYLLPFCVVFKDSFLRAIINAQNYICMLGVNVPNWTNGTFDQVEEDQFWMRHHHIALHQDCILYVPVHFFFHKGKWRFSRETVGTETSTLQDKGWIRQFIGWGSISTKKYASLILISYYIYLF